MNKKQKTSLLVLRLTLGWMLFYAGITKVLNPEWSSAGYLNASKNFEGFYSWLASPQILPITNFLNEWGLTLIGASLILGLKIKWSGILGAIIMLLYYIPILDFPYPNDHSLIVDEHIIYASALVYLAISNADRYWGLEKRFHKNS